MTALSVLDLVMIGEDKTFADSLKETLQLARHVEQHGYRRYWVAEHHNMPGIASSATTLIMSHLAQGTAILRIGSGGVMLPNHRPLVVAEQFATLETLFPGRIDLGLGRAPGADSATSRAVRGPVPQREFSDDVQELMDYLADNGKQPVRAVPGQHDVPIWILGSGMYGAQLAAASGLPFAFASHFAPRFLQQAVGHYKQHFKPSQYLSKPHAMVGVNVFAADTHDEAEYLASSHRHWLANLHAGRPALLPRPVENFMANLPNPLRQSVAQELACTALGTPEEVGTWLRQFIELTCADELMVDARIYDPVARCRSFELAAASISDLLE